MEENRLYQNVKKKICRMIFEGIYQDGDYIPPERKLAEELGVSRVTVRKALKLLEEEHIIERIQGSGTRIAMEYGAKAGNMDIITLVAPAQNTFFSRFIDAFQTAAEKHDSLVLYKQKPKNLSLEQCLFQIYEKDLRNVVLWLEDMEISMETLQKLRGLGMNIVLFDTSYESQYADAICLNNKEAINFLVKRLYLEGCKTLGFVGWEEQQVRSVRIREEAFRKLEPDGVIERIAWEYHNRLEELPMKSVHESLDKLQECDGIVYSVGDLGVLFERAAKERNIEHKAAMIDDFPGAEALNMITMEQDFTKMSEKIFDCLERQNAAGSAWRASVYQMKGLALEKEKTECTQWELI